MHVIENQGISAPVVMVVPVNYPSEIAEYNECIKNIEIDGCSCSVGYTADGSFMPCDDGAVCPNLVVDEFDSYCALERGMKLKGERDSLELRRYLLHFYWHKTGKTSCQEFLKESGLIHDYKYSFPASETIWNCDTDGCKAIEECRMAGRSIQAWSRHSRANAG